MAGLLKKIKDKIYFTINPPPEKQSLAVADIFLANCDGEDVLRWDIIVKYLARENYYGLNDYGFRLYSKMQQARSSADSSEIAIENFRKLIVSWEKNGYDENSCIYLDNDLFLQNGAHRMAMAVYHNLPYINAYYLHRKKPDGFGESFFAENGFTDEELSLIRNKASELYSKMKNNVQV